MPTIVLLIVGVYVLVVGINGNATSLFDEVKKDLPGFIPWIIVIALLGFLAVNHNTEKLGKPLLGLVFLGILVHDWTPIKSNSIAVYKEMTS